MNMPVDLDFDAAGTLYIVEHGRFSQLHGFEPGSGRLTAVELETGERKEILTGLTRPVSVRVVSATRIAVTSLDGTLAVLSRE